MIRITELGWSPAAVFLVVMLVLSALALWWLVRQHDKKHGIS